VQIQGIPRFADRSEGETAAICRYSKGTVSSFGEPKKGPKTSADQRKGRHSLVRHVRTSWGKDKVKGFLSVQKGVGMQRLGGRKGKQISYIHRPRNKKRKPIATTICQSGNAEGGGVKRPIREVQIAQTEKGCTGEIANPRKRPTSYTTPGLY